MYRLIKSGIKNFIQHFRQVQKTQLRSARSEGYTIHLVKWARFLVTFAGGSLN